MCIGANAYKKLHNKLIKYFLNWSNNMIDPIDYI